MSPCSLFLITPVATREDRQAWSKAETGMTILTPEQVKAALAMNFEEERRYQVVRSLIPIGEWPLCLYGARSIDTVRQERFEERVKNGTANRRYDTERSEVEDRELYDDLLERVRRGAEQDELMWSLYSQPLTAWNEVALRELAISTVTRYDTQTYEGERVLARMDLSTLAWIMGLEPGRDDEESALKLRRHLGIEQRATSTVGTQDESEEPLL